jgi:hypothetical protein
VHLSLDRVPASGKSTFAYPLADRINHLLHTSAQGYTQVDTKLALAHPRYKVDKAGIAACIGMDGWHHSRAELDEFPDPAEARRRRVRESPCVSEGAICRD